MTKYVYILLNFRGDYFLKMTILCFYFSRTSSLHGFHKLRIAFGFKGKSAEDESIKANAD